MHDCCHVACARDSTRLVPQAALEFLLQSGRQPDILHCHDWSTAPVASLYWHNYHHFGLGRPRVVFTIHNAEYGLAKIGAAAHHSQRFTTVSPKYREDVRAFYPSPCARHMPARVKVHRPGFEVVSMFLSRSRFRYQEIFRPLVSAWRPVLNAGARRSYELDLRTVAEGFLK